jgi:hypothetical protein
MKTKKWLAENLIVLRDSCASKHLTDEILGLYRSKNT